MRYPRLTERPPHFRLNPAWHPLKQGLVFAGLGNHPGSVRYEDSSHWKNVGRLTNMDPATDWVWVPELGRWALDFDGSNDSIVASTVPLSQKPFSFSVWANYRSLAAWAYMGGYSDSGNQGWKMFFYNTLLRFSCGNYATEVATVTPPGIDAWHHYCGVWYTDGTIRFFLDGIAGTDVTDTGTMPAASGQAFKIGLAGGWTCWNGRESDPLLFDRALASSEISALADPSNAMLSGLILPPRRRLFPAAAIAAGQPTMRRWGGIPHMIPGPVMAGRSW